jgi:hypothetical protein
MQLPPPARHQGDLATSKFYLIKTFKGNLVTRTQTTLGLCEKGFNEEKCLLTIKSYDLLSEFNVKIARRQHLINFYCPQLKLNTEKKEKGRREVNKV